jgi:hypothetical protein
MARWWWWSHRIVFPALVTWLVLWLCGILLMERAVFRRPQPLRRRPLVLLTTYYEDHNDPARTQELRTALADNVAGGWFSAVHVLVMPGTAVPVGLAGRVPVVVREAMPGTVADVQDRYNTTTSRAFLYADLFAYAEAELAGSIVVLSNTDIVFDASVTLLRDRGTVATAAVGTVAYALARVNPPCPPSGDGDTAAACQHLFCRASLCNQDLVVYDAFVFVPPLPTGFSRRVNHRQDQRYAGNIVVHELQKSRVYVSNHCQTVVLTHRHCVRNIEAYLAKQRNEDREHNDDRFGSVDYFGPLE